MLGVRVPQLGGPKLCTLRKKITISGHVRRRANILLTNLLLNEIGTIAGARISPKRLVKFGNVLRHVVAGSKGYKETYWGLGTNREIEGRGGEVEILTPVSPPLGGTGAPNFFFVVGPEGACLSSEHGVPPVRGRGRGIFQRNFGKMLGQKRGERDWETCNR